MALTYDQAGIVYDQTGYTYDGAVYTPPEPEPEPGVDDTTVDDSEATDTVAAEPVEGPRTTREAAEATRAAIFAAATTDPTDAAKTEVVRPAPVGPGEAPTVEFGPPVRATAPVCPTVFATGRPSWRRSNPTAPSPSG